MNICAAAASLHFSCSNALYVSGSMSWKLSTAVVVQEPVAVLSTARCMVVH